MRRILMACLLTTCGAMHAQRSGTIRGTVRLQANGAPLHDADVHVVELRRSIRTGPEGIFEFDNVLPSRYNVLVHVHALNDEKRLVDVKAGETAQLSFEMRLGTVRQEVTVTATGREEARLESFQTVTSLDGHQLALRNAAPSLGEVLDHETGIAKRSFGPGSSRPVVRGFDGDRVLVLQDGVRTGTLSSQAGDHAEPIDGSELERVEVVRGPATLLYGSNAIGGVVNIITRHHELDHHPHEGASGHASLLAGSANGLGGATAGFEYGIGRYMLWGTGGGQRTGDYESPLGAIDNSRARFSQAAVGLARYGQRAFYSLSYGLQDGKYGIPPFDQGEAEADQEHSHDHVSIDWRRHNARIHTGLRDLAGGPFEAVRLTLNLSDWKHRELEENVVGTRFSNRQYTFRGTVDQQRSGTVSGSFGVWWLHRGFKAVGEEALAPPVNQTALAAFAVEELRFERIRLQFGGRFEHNGYDAADGARSRTYNGVSASAGVFVPLWENGAVVASWTTSYRAPALEELYNRGPHLGNLTFEIGNANLSRERGHGLELGLRHTGTRVRAELIGFYNRLSDFVFLSPTGNIEESLIEAEYQQAGARYLGAEGRLDVSLMQDFWLNLGVDAVDAQLQESRIPLPRIPPVRGKIGVDWRRGGFNLRPELLLANQQHQLYFNETRTPGYAVANLLGTYVIATQHMSHLFGVNLFNATDRIYRNHLSFIKDVAPEIGRGIRFTYTINFF